MKFKEYVIIFNMKKISTVILHIFLFFFIIAFLYKMILPLNGISYLFSDSLSEAYAYHDETFLGKLEFLFKSNPHNYYLLSVFHVFFANYLPDFLHINPMEFAKSYFFYIFFVILIFLIAVFSSNFTKYFKKKSFSYLFYPIFFFIFLTMNYYLGNIWFFAQDTFMYAYFLLPALFFLLLKNIENCYVLNEQLPKYSKSLLIFFCIFCSCLIFKLPRYFYISILSLIPIILLYIKSQNKNKDLKNILTYTVLILAVSVSGEFSRFVIIISFIAGTVLHKIFINKNINIKSILSYCSLIFYSMIIPVFANVYLDFAKSRTRPLTDLIQFFPNFCKQFINVIFTENFLLYIILLTLIICSFSFVQDKSKTKRLLVFSLSILFSAILFFIITYPFNLYHDANTKLTLLDHAPLIFSYKMILLNIIFSYAGFIIAFSKLKKHKIEIIILITVFVFSYIKIKTDFSDVHSYFKAQKRKLYIFERLFVDYIKYTKEGFANYEEFRPPYYTLQYYVYNYAKQSAHFDYTLVSVCEKYEDNFICDEKMKKIVKEKTGYVFSASELKELDFSIYDRYKLKRNK